MQSLMRNIARDTICNNTNRLKEFQICLFLVRFFNLQQFEIQRKQTREFKKQKSRFGITEKRNRSIINIKDQYETGSVSLIIWVNHMNDETEEIIT